MLTASVAPTIIPVKSQGGATSGSCPPDGYIKLRNADWPRKDIIIDMIKGIKGASLQNIKNSHVPVKYDLYTVKVDKMPPGLTPEAYLGEMAADINKATNSGMFNRLVGDFDKATVADPGIGSVYFIYIPGDAGSVILVDMTSSSFTFQTITNQYQGTHPENGAREWGFIKNEDGSVTFYTKGVSQADWGKVPGADALGKLLQGHGWKAWLKGVSDEMNRRGGISNPGSLIDGQICQQDEYKEADEQQGLLFQNGGNSIHTLTSGAPGSSNSGELFDTGFVSPGSTATLSVMPSGPFYCTLHPYDVPVCVTFKCLPP